MGRWTSRHPDPRLGQVLLERLGTPLPHRVWGSFWRGSAGSSQTVVPSWSWRLPPQFNSLVLEPPFGETYYKERPFFALFSQIVCECVCVCSVAKNIDLAFEPAKKELWYTSCSKRGGEFRLATAITLWQQAVLGRIYASASSMFYTTLGVSQPCM